MTDRSDQDFQPENDCRAQPEAEYETVLSEFVDRLLDGEDLDSESVRKEHPHIGDRLVDDLQSFIDPDSSSANLPRLFSGP